ncbi:hypothetical protein [Nocardia cyriacigeorgica]|uniref:hypothetical protein n=1 Tax=Nocardia cyriacigeorgica TaxID=135487 RepID=UPI002454F86E|nr:hypothetical protein [Nocardia cyriacigeorgica]
MPDQTPALLTDEQLRRIAAGALCYPDVPGYMAAELLAARTEIAALRNDLDAKASDFDAACRHLDAARARIAELEEEREADQGRVKDARAAMNVAWARVAELEAQQPKPAGYVVGWQDGDRVEIALDESEQPDLLPGPGRHAYTSIGEAHAFLAEIAPEDPDTQFRVYELREVTDRG